MGGLLALLQLALLLRGATGVNRPPSEVAVWPSQPGALPAGSDLRVATFDRASAMQQAQAWCSSSPLCGAFTFQPNGSGAAHQNGTGGRKCYFRKDIQLPLCARSGPWTLFTFVPSNNSWTQHNNTNCWAGHGAECPWTNPNSSSTTVASCKAGCEATPSCTAIVVSAPDPTALPPTPPPAPAGGSVTVYFKLGVVSLATNAAGWRTVVKPASTELVTVNVVGLGALRGLRSAREGDAGTSTYQFLGVRYSQPLNASNRWAHSAPVRAWQPAVRDALGYGASCPSHKQGDKPFEEDCLFINVWSPTLEAKALLPVFVWVHGGSYLTGSGAEQRYNGSSIARLLHQQGGGELHSGMVVCTLNYRLGVLGYLGSQQLRSQTQDNSTGNWGQGDQRLALAWVQKHIHNFGGDPSRVLLMGESSGAGSVSAHLVAPKSFGLFQSAAMSSGAFGTWISAAMPDAQTSYDEILRESHCDNAWLATPEGANSSHLVPHADLNAANALACLRALPLTKLLNLTSVHNSSAYGPVVDGVELTETPIELLRQGKFDRGVKTIVAGSMAEDSGVALKGKPVKAADFSRFFQHEYLLQGWLTKNRSALARMMAVYSGAEDVPNPSNRPGSHGVLAGCPNRSHWYWSAKHCLADAEMFCPARLAAQHFSMRGIGAYQFQFRHRALHVACQVGANHASAIPFWFAATDGNSAVRSVAEFNLSMSMVCFLANVAATGSPNGNHSGCAAWTNLLSWPSYNTTIPQAMPVMVLETAADDNDIAAGGRRHGSHASAALRHAMCEFWASVPEEFTPVT